MLPPRPSVLRRPRHRPDHPRGLRQRPLLPRRAVNSRPGWGERGPPPRHPHLHPKHVGKVERYQRTWPRSSSTPGSEPQKINEASSQALEHPLQVTSTPYRRRRPTNRLTTGHWRHQRPARQQLAATSPECGLRSSLGRTSRPRPARFSVSWPTDQDSGDARTASGALSSISVHPVSIAPLGATSLRRRWMLDKPDRPTDAL